MGSGQGEILEKIIRDRIRQKGRLTFAEYMTACLYEPKLGYYTSPGRKVGAAGDFYTSSNVHAAFGRTIARELCRMWENLGRPSGFTVVEVGAGGGRLAGDILDEIIRRSPELYATLNYRLVEAEPSLQQAQQELLAVHADRLAWETPADLAAGAHPFVGCLLSNELIDSFPVHLVQMTPAGLMEVYVSIADDGFLELVDTPSTTALARYFELLGMTLKPGQRAEVNLNALSWLEGVAKALQRGFVLTIDYGFEAAELYGPMRANGTLVCYWQHTVVDDPYLRPGEQDMTSHVDFTTLMRRGEELGLRNVWFGEQYRFLMAAGMMEELMVLETQATSEQDRLKNRLALKKLLLPEGGMGDTFKVLVQGKGVAAPQLLCQREWTGLL